MNLYDEGTRIFDDYKTSEPDIIIDGIVDEKGYAQSKPKIIYIMKEVNGGKNWDLREFLYDGGVPTTWDNITRWTKAILDINKNYVWGELKEIVEEQRKEQLRKIGVINLKKSSGGSTSNSKLLRKGAIKYKDLIIEQLKLFEPDIVVCCGTAHYFMKYVLEEKNVEWQSTSNGVEYLKRNNCTIISYLHPNARASDNVLYYPLINGIKEILLHTRED